MNFRAFVLSLTIALATAYDAGAQTPDSAARRAASAARTWHSRNRVPILRELADFLAIPNVAADSANIRRNARFIVDMLQRRNARAQILESPGGGSPAVFGEIPSPGATRTVVFYAHYDGQPVDTTQWATPPWQPTLRTAPLGQPGSSVRPLEAAVSGGQSDEWRLYARSAGDDKSPIVAMLAALDAMRAAGIRPSVNLKFFFEGEEEAGSDHLRPMLQAHRDLMKADAWIFADGPVDQSRRQQVVFGVRGVMGLELTVYGPTRTLHSGHYGNWAPNPAVMLAHLLASMRDQEGRITIDGFMADVAQPTEAEHAALAATRANDPRLRRELGLARTEGEGAVLDRIMMPALNVRGLSAGAVGEKAANAIPTQARASIDFRLVPNQVPARVRAVVDQHLRRQGYHLVDREPTAEERLAHPKIARVQWEQGYPAYRTPMDLDISRRVIDITRSVSGETLVLPTLGGSLPMYVFAEELRVPLIIVPIVNHDNNQHAANENLRLRNLWDGIELFAGLMAGLGR